MLQGTEREAIERLREAIRILREVDPQMAISRVDVLLTLALSEPEIVPPRDLADELGVSTLTATRAALALGATDYRGSDGYHLVEPAPTTEYDGKLRVKLNRAGWRLCRRLAARNIRRHKIDG